MYMKNAINNTTNTGNNHMNTFNKSTATNIAIMINIKSCNSMYFTFIEYHI